MGVVNIYAGGSICIKNLTIHGTVMRQFVVDALIKLPLKIIFNICINYL